MYGQIDNRQTSKQVKNNRPQIRRSGDTQQGAITKTQALENQRTPRYLSNMPSSCLDMKSNILQIGKKDRANFKSPANDKKL